MLRQSPCARYDADADVIQGAAANVPTALGILGTTFPPGKAKNYAFSAYGERTEMPIMSSDK